MIQIAQFLTLAEKHPVVDVRAPSEFTQGHIAGAVNIPLFSDEERSIVGTAYKQINKEAAMYKGLDFAGKKLVKLAKEGEKKAGNGKTLLVHCWRGGMRSKSMVWLFETMGIKCYLLEGGYKAYRRHILAHFEKPVNILIIGGRTGSGKTDILHYLGKMGEQIVDLEGLAHHKGSAFGALGEASQPSTEQFENQLFKVLSPLDPGKITWVEDESRNVGKCVIPGSFYQQMKESRIVFLDISMEQRAGHLVGHYARYKPDELKDCILKISKRLGGDRTKEALESVDSSDFKQTAKITLHYYDKAYMFSLKKNHADFELLRSDRVDPAYNAKKLKDYVEKGEN